MLSRAADSIYWMSRSIERAENIARFIDVNLILMLDMPMDASHQWAPLIHVTGDDALFYERYGQTSQENVVHFLTFDREYPNSILSCLQAARENARSIRENISIEMWEKLNTFYLSVRDASRTRPGFSNLHDFYDHIKSYSHMFSGITDSTMLHNEGWHFARMGRLFERADKTSRIVDIKYFILLPNVTSVGAPIDTIQWAALLKSASGLEMYRRKHGRLVPEQVANFLLLDNQFPRAIHYCLIKAEESMHEISGCPLGAFSNPAEKFMGRLRSDLDFATIEEILAYGLHEYIDHFQLKLNQLGSEVHRQYFALPEPAGAERV